MNAPMLKLYRDGKGTHGTINQNNMTLSADEKINLRL